MLNSIFFDESFSDIFDHWAVFVLESLDVYLYLLTGLFNFFELEVFRTWDESLYFHIDLADMRFCSKFEGG